MGNIRDMGTYIVNFSTLIRKVFNQKMGMATVTCTERRAKVSMRVLFMVLPCMEVYFGTAFFRGLISTGEYRE